MKPFTCHGHWWLPSNPERRVAGILTYSPIEGVTLDLKGAFTDSLPLGQQFLSYRIINGVAEHGRPFTLCDCAELSSNLAGGLASTIASTFAVRFAIEGACFQQAEEIVFHKFSINYSLIDEWTPLLPCNESPVEAEDRQWIINYGGLAPIHAQVGSSKLTFGSQLHKSFGLSKLSVTAVPLFISSTVEPMSLDDYLVKTEFLVRCFLMLALGQTVFPQIVSAKSHAIVQRLLSGTEFEIDLPIYFRVGPIELEPLRRSEVLLEFKDVADNFESYLQNWFARMAVLRPVCELYFGTMTNSQMYVQHVFLSLAQALETYHRRTRGGIYMDGPTWKPIQESLVRALPQSLDKNFRDDLKRKLHYLPQFSLRKRLKELAVEYEEITRGVIRDTGSFVGAVVDNRNYLTHYDKQPENQCGVGDMHELSTKMRCLLDCCLLTEMGMDKRKVAEVMGKSRRYEWLSWKQFQAQRSADEAPTT